MLILVLGQICTSNAYLDKEQDQQEHETEEVEWVKVDDSQRERPMNRFVRPNRPVRTDQPSNEDAQSQQEDDSDPEDVEWVELPSQRLPPRTTLKVRNYYRENRQPEEHLEPSGEVEWVKVDDEPLPKIKNHLVRSNTQVSGDPPSNEDGEEDDSEDVEWVKVTDLQQPDVSNARPNNNNIQTVQWKQHGPSVRVLRGPGSKIDATVATSLPSHNFGHSEQPQEDLPVSGETEWVKVYDGQPASSSNTGAIDSNARVDPQSDDEGQEDDSENVEWVKVTDPQQPTKPVKWKKRRPYTKQA